MLTSESASHSLTNSRLAAAEQTRPLDKRDTGTRKLLESANQQNLPYIWESPGKAQQNVLLNGEEFGLLGIIDAMNELKNSTTFRSPFRRLNSIRPYPVGSERSFLDNAQTSTLLKLYFVGLRAIEGQLSHPSSHLNSHHEAQLN